MQGHIRKRTHTTKTGKKTVRWYVVVDIGKTLDGKRRQKWHGGYASRGDAEQARAELVSGIYTGTYIEPSGLTLGGWITDHWLACIAARAKRTTIASYMANLRHHVLPTIGGLRLHELTAAHLDALYADLLRNGRINGSGGLRPRTVGNIHMLVHLAIADACSAGIIRRNVAEDAHPPRRTRAAKQPIRAWDTNELAHFLGSVAADHLQALWHLAALTGMRRGEIAALRWRNLDLTQSRIAVAESRTRVGTETITSTPKNGAARTVDLDPGTVEIMKRHRRRQSLASLDGHVFVYPNGSPLRPDYLSERFLRLAAKTDLPRIRFHDLRHTHATIALRAGVPVHVVAQRLGHANASMTLAVYAHVMPGQQATAARQIADLLTASATTEASGVPHSRAG